eukprot:SAG22_NODE_34_length_27479_cov_10.947480_10_plen_87_part_00
MATNPNQAIVVDQDGVAMDDAIVAGGGGQPKAVRSGEGTGRRNGGDVPEPSRCIHPGGVIGRSGFWSRKFLAQAQESAGAETTSRL